MKRSERFKNYYHYESIIERFYEKHNDLMGVSEWIHSHLKVNKIIDLDFLNQINIIKPIEIQQNWNNSFQDIIIIEDIFKQFDFDENKKAIDEFEKINEVESFGDDEKILAVKNKINLYRYAKIDQKYSNIDYLYETIKINEDFKVSDEGCQFVKNPEINLNNKKSKTIIFILVIFLLIGLIIGIILLSLVLSGVL